MIGDIPGLRPIEECKRVLVHDAAPTMKAASNMAKLQNIVSGSEICTDHYMQKAIQHAVTKSKEINEAVEAASALTSRTHHSYLDEQEIEAECLNHNGN